MSGFALNSKVVLITGGARGIGKGMAQAFLEAGAKVMVADLGPGGLADWNYKLADDDELSQTVAELSPLGSIAATQVDVTSKTSCIAAVAATVEAFGGLDVLVNNAGVVQSGSLADFSEAHWDQTFAVNSKGLFLMSQAALPHLRSAASNDTSACIINTASIAGKQGYPNMTAYCGSKFAAIGITQSLANELAADNIRVNAICPGMVGTAMWLEHLLPSKPGSNTNKDQDFEAMMTQTIPLGRPQTAQDMGQAAVYLASANNVTGVALNVAGGFEMH